MDNNIQNVIDDIYTVTKHRLDANDPLVKVLYFSLFIADKHQYILADILKEIERHCPEYAQLDNERLSMLPDVLHMQIERFNRNSEKFVEYSQKKTTNDLDLEESPKSITLATLILGYVVLLTVVIGLATIIRICLRILSEMGL
ncbi:hypothetical protein [Snodgrassella alvi]|uniref:Uncharacterized protein n=1 Tax=Snodgrassella alvi TaxID=1196083 RepID=A0A2N9WVD2_9NEIS|nr:hypothetical protein [Snodgrassella alvi]PIT16917.1 hypothetical protein BGI32_03665 [Snodgrassella alvi]PIT22020.1 hypothetical protein BGI34_00455 [Snodgrassella alvi]